VDDRPTQQKTKAGSLLCTGMDDVRRVDRTMRTRKNSIIQKPVYVLGEMQVSKQDMKIRVISYI
jgi:hypothetical protein